MKIMTILGTRPEIIRLSLIIKKLDTLCDHVLVHTGQNFDASLSDIFFEQLGVRQPDHYLGVRGSSFGEQIGKIIMETEKVMLAERPDRLLILGDTNSGLSAFVAKRMGIPVYHMEAGNRCYDDRVPEEVNRRVIDHSSDVLMPYTERSRANLLREGILGEGIFVTGNPIYEVLQSYKPKIGQSTVLAQLGLTAGQYFLVTMHRAENVDSRERLKNLTTTLCHLQQEYSLPVIISTHPRTKAKMQAFDVAVDNDQVRFLSPFGFFDFIMLERTAFCILSDSGTVQEECAIFRVPNVTIRDVTERPETIECGSNMLSGADEESILESVRAVLSLHSPWTAPCEYLVDNVSDTVVKIVLGYPSPMTMPRVSVVIPVYNGTNYLREAIDSVLAQTYDDYEVLIVDDGSTDGTWELIRSYGERVRGFRKPNGGVASALNLGLSEMRGQWFAWLSHDDLWLPSKLERQIEYLDRYPQFAACYTDYFVIDSHGTVLRQVETPWYPRAQALRMLFGQMYIGGSTILVERTCFDQVGLFSEMLRRTQDVDMWMRLLRQFDIGRVPRKLAKARTHSGQDSRRVEVHDQEKRATFQRLFAEFGVAGLFPDWGASASEPQTIARAHTWFADTMLNYRSYYSLAGAHYALAIASDPSLYNPARFKLVVARARQRLRIVRRRLRHIVLCWLRA